MVALGDGVWGVIEDTLPGAPVTKVFRQTSRGIATAFAKPLPSQSRADTLNWGLVDAALRELAGSIDGFFGPDPALLDTSSNAAGLAALSAAWGASRGATRFTITRVASIPPGGNPRMFRPRRSNKTVIFHDQARKIHGAGGDVQLLVEGPRAFRFHMVSIFRALGRYRWTIRREGGCFSREPRMFFTGFPAHMRFVKLFSDDLITEQDEPPDALTWLSGLRESSGFGASLPEPPALVLNPDRVGQAYGIVFKPLRVIGGKTRIEYLWTGTVRRMHLVVRVSRGRIEAIRIETLDQAGRLTSWQSIRIAYTVDPALTSVSPTCLKRV